VTVVRYLVGAFLLSTVAVPVATAATPSCPVTQAPTPAFVPPLDEAPQPRDAAAAKAWEERWFWYGSPQLWTQVPRSGHVSRRDKIFWWSAGYGDRARIEQRPNIIVTINRIGSGVTTAINELPTHAGFDGATSLLTMVDFPEAGCWQVNASYRGNQLAFVVDVP
jgi:hypothetical protein